MLLFCENGFYPKKYLHKNLLEKKELLINRTKKYLDEHFLNWDTISFTQETSIKEKKTFGNKRKSEETMNEEEPTWSPYIDSSRFSSYVRKEGEKSKKEKTNKKYYRFGLSIVTDGISVSIPLRLENYNEERSCKKQKMKETKELFKKITKKEMEEQKNKSYSLLKGKKIVGVDPGKHSIIYLTSDSKIKRKENQKQERMQISNVERRRALGTKVFKHIQKNHKKRFTDWQELESSLSLVCSKSTTIKGFQTYMEARFRVQDKLYEYYSNFMFRIHQWERYKRSKRFEYHMVKQIQEKFGRDCVLAYGTWNRNSQMKGLIPSQTCGMRRALSKKFTVINTPEAYTTKTCSKCFEGTMEKCLSRLHPNPKKKRENPDAKIDVRGLRRCNNEKCRVYFNRDYNAAINICSNLLYRIHHESWNPKFTRQVRIQDEITQQEQKELDQLQEYMLNDSQQQQLIKDSEIDTLDPRVSTLSP